MIHGSSCWMLRGAAPGRSRDCAGANRGSNMNRGGEDLPMTERERALAATAGGMARIVWRRYYRNVRLWWRAQCARVEHETIHGTGDPTQEPVGLLNASGVRLPLKPAAPAPPERWSIREDLPEYDVVDEENNHLAFTSTVQAEAIAVRDALNAVD